MDPEIEKPVGRISQQFLWMTWGLCTPAVIRQFLMHLNHLVLSFSIFVSALWPLARPSSPHLRSWTSSSLPSDPSNSCWLPKFGDIYWSMTCNSFKTVLIHLNPRLNQFESFPGSGNIRRAANVARWSFLDLKMPSSSVSLLQVLCVRRHRIQSMGTQETLNLRCWRSHVSIICV